MALQNTTNKKRREKNGALKDGGNVQEKVPSPQSSWLSLLLFFILSIQISVMLALFLMEVKVRRENDSSILSSELEKILFPLLHEDEPKQEKHILLHNVDDGSKDLNLEADEVRKLDPTEVLPNSFKDESEDKKKSTKDSSKGVNQVELKDVKVKDVDENVDSHSQSDLIELDTSIDKNLDLERPVDEKEFQSNFTVENMEGKTVLKDLYLEVEGLADEILSRDPKNELLELLAPHLEDVLKDMENGKYSGVEEALQRAKKTLEAVKEKLAHDAVSDPLHSLNEDEIDEVRKILKDSQKKDERPNLEDNSIVAEVVSPSDENKPVDEVIPDPVHVTPLGDPNEHSSKGTIASPSKASLDGKESRIGDSEIPKEKSSQTDIKSGNGKRERLPESNENELQNEELSVAEIAGEKKNMKEMKDGLIEKDLSLNKEESSPETQNLRVDPSMDDTQHRSCLDGCKSPLFPAEKNNQENDRNGLHQGDKTKKVDSKKTVDKDFQKTEETDSRMNKETDSGIPEESDSKMAEETGKKMKVESVTTEDNKLGKTEETIENIKEVFPEEDQKNPQQMSTQKIKMAKEFLQKDPAKSLKIFDEIITENPPHPPFEALYGKAQALDLLAEREMSNTHLEEAIRIYQSLLNSAEAHSLDDDTIRSIGLTCSTRMAFRGWQNKSIRVLQFLSQKYPTNSTIQNKLGVAFLMLNQPTAAFEIFKEILETHPHDGFAQVHYGFILKTTFDKNTEGVKYLRLGINSGADGTSDGRFYFHLGDGLQRLGKNKEAYEVYDEGVEKGLFMSRHQRSLYNVERLTSRPIWKLEETSYTQFFRKLESHWKEIKKEAVSILSGDSTKGFKPETENLRDTGDWQQFELYARGKKVPENCAKVPITCALIEKFGPAASCKRGQVKFSLMQPGTHVWSHTGPTNCRLRAHLGLIVPKGLKMRVAEEFISWEEGKVLVFDDSFEHEVWHEGQSARLVLIVDVWHPDLTEAERRSLSPI